MFRMHLGFATSTTFPTRWERGERYKTPVGPIRLDFSYNLNPPVYPVIYDFNGSLPYEGQASHFNFFFSIGQAF